MSVNVYNKTDDVLTPIAGGTLYADSPIGSIIPYGGSTAPDGWLLCQGQAISRTAYAELFAVIGTAFGTGDGSTTFNLPDLREATTKGVGLSGKTSDHYDADGIALGEFIEDRIKNHRHTYSGSTDAISGDNWAGMGPVGFTVGDMDAFGAGRATVSNGMGAWRAEGTSKKIVEGYAVNIDLAHIHAYHGTTDYKGYDTNEVKAVGVNYIIKAKHTPVPADFMDTVEDAVNECKILPYEFNKSSNISAFNRKWLVTGSPLVWTATHTGRLTIRCLKHGDGYSLYLSNQSGVLLDSYDNFFGDETHGLTVSDASITLQAWVRKGDVIKLETNLPADTDWADKYFVQLGLLAYNNNFD